VADSNDKGINVQAGASGLGVSATGGYEFFGGSWNGTITVGLEGQFIFGMSAGIAVDISNESVVARTDLEFKIGPEISFDKTAVGISPTYNSETGDVGVEFAYVFGRATVDSPIFNVNPALSITLPIELFQGGDGTNTDLLQTVAVAMWAAPYSNMSISSPTNFSQLMSSGYDTPAEAGPGVGMLGYDSAIGPGFIGGSTQYIPSSTTPDGAPATVPGSYTPGAGPGTGFTPDGSSADGLGDPGAAGIAVGTEPYSANGGDDSPSEGGPGPGLTPISFQPGNTGSADGFNIPGQSGDSFAPAVSIPSVQSLSVGAVPFGDLSTSLNGFNLDPLAYNATPASTTWSTQGQTGSQETGDGDGDGGGYTGDGDGDGDEPVVLDLTGKGINITPLSQSNKFFNAKGDGYQHKTAWAGAGNGVLFIDTTSKGQLTQANQVVFTDWDPTATSDMQALLDVFDTNHDGKLDAGDADFDDFFVMVTNANGTETAYSLAQLGITSINLNANATNIAFLTISLPRAAAFDALQVAEQMKTRGAVPWRGC
jgi:hypothetical protein